jgi:hypothetical protein
MTAIAVLSLFWLLGPGLLVPVLFSRRRDQQDKVSTRFDHLRATSTYRSALPTLKPETVFNPR